MAQAWIGSSRMRVNKASRCGVRLRASEGEGTVVTIIVGVVHARGVVSGKEGAWDSCLR